MRLIYTLPLTQMPRGHHTMLQSPDRVAHADRLQELSELL
jgi:hypothetical protein